MEKTASADRSRGVPGKQSAARHPRAPRGIDDPFLQKLAAAPLSKSRRHLVAVSGGRDSVALLQGLHALGFRKLTVVHLDHRLRGRSAQADARFVASLARKFALPLITGRADVRLYAAERGLSIEHAARELRHVFFESAAKRARCSRILLAHHADDQIETCLFNFLRGSGAAGLAGMRFQKTHRSLTLLRPLLGLRRADIDTFVARNGIAFREDATNSQLAATRNKLRHRVIPILLETFGDSCAESILRAAEIFAAEEDWMRDATPRSGATLAVKDVQAMPLALQRRLVRLWLEEQGCDDIGFAETERVLTLLDAARGPAKVNLPRGRHARRRQGLLFLE